MVLCFSGENFFTNSLLKYFMNKILDLTNSNEMHFSDILLKKKSLLLMVF